MDSTPFDREQLRERFAGLACKGVFVGTSSWKYEYTERFKTVSVDAAYYTFPSRGYLESLAAQVNGCRLVRHPLAGRCISMMLTT